MCEYGARGSRRFVRVADRRRDPESEESMRSTEAGFDARAYLPRDLYEMVTDIRVRQPNIVDEEAGRRARRRTLAPDGKLIILAADHPGRSNLRIQDDQSVCLHAGSIVFN